ncbi:MAG: hypothetical protein ACP5N3_01270 [Candidatus Nanoarchaeia archaeon]
MKRTKAGLSTIWITIFTIGIFCILLFSSCNALKNVFRTYKASTESTQDIVEAIQRVAALPAGSLELAALTLDEDTAIYIFSKDKTAVVEEKHSVATQIDIIARPEECGINKTCVCLCTDFSFAGFDADSIEYEKLSQEYPSNMMSSRPAYLKLDCEKLSCDTIEDAVIQEKTELKNIISNPDFEKEQISVWKQGFSLWNTEAVSYREKSKMQAKSEYVDLYIIKNSDGTIRFCYDNDCQEIQ